MRREEVRTVTPADNPMLEALHAARPNAALADKLSLYGRFVGSWALDIEFYPLGAPSCRAEGEWHFAWVLDGKAIQDVWIFPARRLRSGDGEPWHRYGSTFRWYDPTIDAWHITYFDPSRPSELRQLGRAVGNDIVQIGEDHRGLQRRWRFLEVTDRTFRWVGDVSWDKGASFTLEMQMQAQRRP
jgi:hypothetical protein